MGVWTALKRSFVAGIVLLIPLVVTLYVLQLLVGFAVQFIDPVVQNAELEGFTGDVELLARAVAVGLILIVVTIVGYIAQQPAGQRLFGSLGRLVSVIPVVRTIYSTIRQMATSFSSAETSYDSLVLVEFPRKDIYAIGLSTSDSPRPVEEVTGGPTQNIFLPSSPNPASGRLVMVPEDQIHEVDLSVRQGMRMLMTTGVGVDEAIPVPDSIDVSLEPETPRREESTRTEGEDKDEDESEDEDEENPE
ncbi:MAG: putative membrane protein [Halovenus sp.]|jgi:uncharacterized membrane protein